VEAIVANKVAPGLLDRYLGHSGYDSQQTDEAVSPTRRDNLWEPLPGDHGAHGEFDSRASTHSAQLWARMNLPWLALAGVGIIAAALAGTRAPQAVERLRDKLAA